MIADIFTKNSHYRADDIAQTVECIGPDSFKPYKVKNLNLDAVVVGLRLSVAWANGGPFGKSVMVTSIVDRLERQASQRPAKAARLRELMEDEGMSRAEARAMIDFET